MNKSKLETINNLFEENKIRSIWDSKKEGSELVTNANQLKMKAKDGKYRETDALYTEGILRFIESVSFSKAEPFNVWLAKLGKMEKYINL